MALEGMVGQIGTTVGTGAVVGGVSGFTAKKVLKLVVAIVSIQLALVAYLDHRGILDIHWDAVDGTLATVGQHVGSFVTESMPLASTLPVGVGFGGGFILGFKRA